MQAQSTVKKGRKSCCGACGKLYRGGFSDFRLRFAGTYHESDRARLEAIAEEYGIRDKYELLGKRSDVDKLFECADIVFMCSQFEAFGRVTVEGMLSGALVIGADTGGTAEILQDGKTGYLYRQGDAESLCSVIQKAVQNRDAAAAVAAAVAIMPSRILPHGTTPSRLRKCIKSYARRGKFPSRQSS